MFFRKWHRRIGFSASLFLFNLAITGIILNHYEAFNLHRNYVQSNWILDWYSIKHADDIYCLGDNRAKFCEVGSELFTVKDTEVNFLSADLGRLISIKKFDANNYLITNKSISIFDEDFQLVDSLNILDEISENVASASFSNNKLYLHTETKLLLFDALLSNEMSFDYQNINSLSASEINLKDNETTINVNQLTDSVLQLKLSEKYRQRQISYLKLVQDLHSGQIFSVQGKLLTDLVGIIIMLLAISGFITWNRRKKSM